jgi:hypothetical protein
MLRGVIHERTRRHGFRLLANELAPRIARPDLRDQVVSSASLILTDGGLALSEPKAAGAQGSTKVLAASSLAAASCSSAAPSSRSRSRRLAERCACRRSICSG